MKIKVFNFKKHWKDKVLPIILEEDIQLVLDECMEELVETLVEVNSTLSHRFDDITKSMSWHRGDAPYLFSTTQYWDNHRNPSKNSVGWYQVFGCCHWIIRFEKALAKKLYPELHWKVLTSNRHATVVGYDQKGITMIFDILVFEHMCADQILDYADYDLSDKQYKKKWRS